MVRNIVTSEPRGAYHIAPMYQEMKSSGANFTHLVPYPDDLQGENWEAISSSVNIIENCDRIILVGGGFTAWCESVLFYATSLGKPIYLSELAYGNFRSPPKQFPDKFGYVTNSILQGDKNYPGSALGARASVQLFG